MLLRELDLIDEIRFVHPKDMQDGIVPIAARDIVTNLPHVEGCRLAFDHHAIEMSRKRERSYPNHVINPSAASARTCWPPSTRPTRRSSRARRSSAPRAGCRSTS